jgi:hypothetical protein
MLLLSAIAKWLLILTTLWGVLRIVMWLVSDRGHGLHDFYIDLLHPIYNKAEILIWLIPLLLLLFGFAVYSELPPNIQQWFKP